MELADAITDYLSREGLSQKALAEQAKVSQATVSRARKRRPKRRSVAYARLCRYMHEYAAGARPAGDPVLDAVRETWDGSQEHAVALAKLILASRELWPDLGKGTTP